MDEGPALSADAFHRGRFHLLQPLRGGHRAGMDALVLAAAIPSGFGGRLVDFGAGAGAVGLAVAARCPAAQVVLVENSTEMAGFARQSMEYEGNRHLAGRLTLLEADVSKAAAEAALGPQSADFIVMNPPFNNAIDRATQSELKRAAHVMEDGLFETWIRAAAAIARPGARIAIIARPVSVAPILAALSRRFGAAELVAIHARSHLPAIRIVVRARHGVRGALSILPPLALQEADQPLITARAEAINAGEASLFGD